MLEKAWSEQGEEPTLKEVNKSHERKDDTIKLPQNSSLIFGVDVVCDNQTTLEFLACLLDHLDTTLFDRLGHGKMLHSECTCRKVW